MSGVVEREDKWDVDDDFVVPRLDDLVPGSAVNDSEVELVSSYFDTVDGDLLSHGVTRRRRDGDDESGWQLKVPHPDGRVEIARPLSETPPDALLEIIEGVRLGKHLVAVTTIRTVRVRHRIMLGERVFAEIDDDTVRAQVPTRSEVARTWRELEIELGADAAEVPTRLVERLSDAGATPALHSSKLARVLSPEAGGRTPQSKADRAVQTYLSTEIEKIFAGDIGLRRGNDPVHDTRVATRRLRSTLRVFGPLLDARVTEPVNEELKWLAGALGAVRDCHVQRALLHVRIDELPAALVLGPVTARIDGDLLAKQVAGRGVLADAMSSDRYLALLAALQEWRTTLPIRTSLTGKQLVKRARRAARKADKRLDAALAGHDDELLHRARKAAKRARYAAELVAPVGHRKRARSNAKHYKKIQRLLGDYNDSVIAADYLWHTALDAGTTGGENGFTFGLLYGNEQRRAADACRAVAEFVGT